jgi:hypothetical protein
MAKVLATSQRSALPILLKELAPQFEGEREAIAPTSGAQLQHRSQTFPPQLVGLATGCQLPLGVLSTNQIGW